MAIAWVLFDADGVVIHPWRFRRYLEEVHEITPAMTRDFFADVFNDCLTGRARLSDVLPPYLCAWGWPGTTEAFIITWMEVENAPDERLLAKIEALREDGYHCGLATSQEQNRARFMAVDMGFDAVFDDQFYSCHIGCRKPQREFYRSIESALSVDGDEILFWDDSGVNVAAARQAGWHAERYRGYADFQSRIGTLLAAA
jgi:putative hydrolase of the HAD superfamily